MSLEGEGRDKNRGLPTVMIISLAVAVLEVVFLADGTAIVAVGHVETIDVDVPVLRSEAVVGDHEGLYVRGVRDGYHAG